MKSQEFIYKIVKLSLDGVDLLVHLSFCVYYVLLGTTTTSLKF